MENEKKIVFFDIDGTLLNHEKELPQSTKDAIKELKDQGVYVAIATGRAPFMFEDLREELDIQSYVSFNGQYVVFEGEVIYKNPLDPNKMRTLLQFSEKMQHPLVFMNHETMKANVENHFYIHESMGSLKFTHPEFGPSFLDETEIYQALLFIEDNDQQTYVKEYGDFHFIRWHQYSTDILPKGGSKAIGIQRMLEKIPFKKENVYAFGDGLNDVEMISFVANGVAMGNSHPELLKVAKHVTKDVGEDGIWHGLNSFGLIKQKA
ncbi:Cof-type HAD-IIB family hydrolase [Sutcliffiella rhizosphaerae]|uniref:Bifunctional phosphatase/peptidyl-prolyl cis-trans isomerase n=1 Tax=Sutcliffiella rhizosphaerae TaxID=2880967 RepID=A0ABN8AB27_9BACI|nr:Cof-type HAD-IIB family hydrolase [Sutcliffiella rhizosphaerae]CAG9619885.1 Putative bifunctional phosphatase/peptidyl-prolyl cis-trans isomerase [Sutcliffiella rhizosphaerae]